MNATTTYYKLGSITMDSWDLAKTAYEAARRSWLCHGCCFPKPHANHVDAVVDQIPDATPLNGVNGTALGACQ